MNKNNAIILFSIVIIFLTVYLRNIVSGQSNPNDTQSQISSPTPASPQSKSTLTLDLEINEKKIRVLWLKIEDSGRIQLFSNFSESLTSDQAIENNPCSSLISGGFYTQENTPIGLFVTEGRQISSHSQNKLLNGVFSINYDQKPKITSFLPEENLRLGLQSGPILVNEAGSINIPQVKEEYARRVVVAISEDDEIIFMVFYDKDSVFMGPKLTELPEAVLTVSEKIGVGVKNALNLDGGSASAFYSQDIKLRELTPLGSYFCIK
ncbi:phosphodiester glycosidase family protein [Patescibacteria group bacterium]|nr:phosphodiester glycosidase family protein [Patescibacteria group bacterium]